MKKLMTIEEQKEAINKVKARITISSPFFGFIVLQYPTVFDDRIETACTDGKTIKFNPGMALRFSVSELEFVWAHEACHIALMHPLRIKGLNHTVANIAADYVVNLILADSGYSLPQGSLFDAKFKGIDVKTVYDILIRENPQLPENLGIGEITEPSGSESEVKGIEQRIKEVISQAETQARICGKLPGSLKEIIEKLLYPKRPVSELLQEFMQSCLRDDYTWNRKNRRYHDFYMPARDVETVLQSVVIVIDTSGSMGEEELSKCAGFIDAARKEVSIEKTVLLYCDTQVHYAGEYGLEDIITFEVSGRGGTNFDPPFTWVTENMVEPPDCLIYLTDLCGKVTVAAPSYPVLWIRYGDWKDSVSFGQVIDMD